MNAWSQELRSGVERWDAQGLPRPRVVVVSGSGLEVDLGPPTHGPFPFSELLPFPCDGIPGHRLTAELVLPAAGRPVLYFRGRLHAYQGYDPGQVVYPVRLGALLGAGVLCVTNASGGLQPDLRAGDLLLLRDHINLMGLSPLRGELPGEWGPRFPDMTEAYDPDLRHLVHDVAATLNLELQDGVYAGVLGPSYETPAETRMLARLGADVVGMSSVLEVIAARHLGVRCLGLSLVSNPAAGVSSGTLDHADVLAASQKAAPRVEALLRRLLAHDELLSLA